MAVNNQNAKKVVPVFFGADQRFTPYLMTCVASLIEKTSARKRYNIHILHTDINEDTQNMIRGLAKDNVSIEFNDVSETIEQISASLPIRDYYSPSTYFRFVIASHFPQYDKALYIDADTIVNQDVSKLYDTNIGNAYVGAVPEAVMTALPDCGRYAEKVLGIARARYFNAGMLIINSKAWREHDVLGQFLFLISYYNFVVAQDQDYLNVICKNKVHYLPRRWNMETIRSWNIDPSRIGIIHYAFAAKPWQDINCLYGTYFWRVASKMPIYGEIKTAFANVTNEKLESIAKVVEGVCETCRNEIARSDNFLRRVDANRSAKPLMRDPTLAELVVRLRAHA